MRLETVALGLRYTFAVIFILAVLQTTCRAWAAVAQIFLLLIWWGLPFLLDRITRRKEGNAATWQGAMRVDVSMLVIAALNFISVRYQTGTPVLFPLFLLAMFEGTLDGGWVGALRNGAGAAMILGALGLATGLPDRLTLALVLVVLGWSVVIGYLVSRARKMGWGSKKVILWLSPWEVHSS